MSRVNFLELDDFVYYGDREENILQFEWFNRFPFNNKKQFCYILKTPIGENNIRDLLMNIFPKIFSIDVQTAGILDEFIKAYLITFTLHYDDFWDTIEDNLFLYCMSFLHTMDFHIISETQSHFSTFEDNLMLALENKNYKIVPEKFFDSKMARMFNSQRDMHYIPLWGCVSNDINAIKTILTSPRNMREVLLRVPQMNCTTISKEISDEYSLMRRTL